MALRNYALTQFGGLNTEVSDFNLKDWEATAISNVDVDYRGYLRNRLGYSKVDSTAIAGGPSVLGLYKFYKDGVDNPLFICAAGDKIYKLVDTTWTDMVAGLDTSDGRWNFVTHHNVCYGTDDKNIPVKITKDNGTYSIADWVCASSDPDNDDKRPRDYTPYIIVHRDRIFMAGDPDDISLVMYTNLADTPDIVAVGITGVGILKGDGQKVTGLSKLGFNLIVTKKHQIHHISGCTSADFVRRMIVPGKGCFAHRSLVNTGNTIIMLHDSGILNFNGQNIQDMSLNFKSKIDGILSGYIQNACGVFYNKRYWLSYTSSGITNDKTLVVDAISGACTEYSFGVNAFYLDLANNLYGAGDSGFVYLLENTQQDAEVDIASYWQGKYFDFGMPGVTKRLKEVVVYCSLATESLTFTFNVDHKKSADQGRQDWAKTVTPTSSTITEVRFSCARELVGKRFRLKIAHEGEEPYRVQQVIFRFEPIARKGVVV